MNTHSLRMNEDSLCDTSHSKWCWQGVHKKFFSDCPCSQRKWGSLLRLGAMTISAATLCRVTALALTAGLGLVACSSDDDAEPPETSGSALELPEAPEATEEEIALAETLETEFDVSNTATLEDQWPDITAMNSALTGTQDPDLCQQAGAEQYGLLVEAKPPTVLATVDTDALLDEHASGETATVYFANDAATTAQLHEVHENTDTACVEEYESAIAHETTQTDVEGQDVEVHTWQVVASDQLTGRMIDVVSDDIFVRYAAAYPPQVIAEDLEDDAAETFNEAATERALAVFEAAAAQ